MGNTSKTYKLGSTCQYVGLVKVHTERFSYAADSFEVMAILENVTSVEPYWAVRSPFISISKNERGGLVTEYKEFLKNKIKSCSTTGQLTKSKEFDLLVLIEDLANEKVAPFLKNLNLPYEYQHQINGLYFVQAVEQKALLAGRNGHQQIMARIAAEALANLKTAETFALNKNFEKAAIRLAYIAPQLAILHKMEMEHAYHIGDVRLKTNPRKEVSGAPRTDPEINEAIQRIFKDNPGETTTELWDRFVADMGAKDLLNEKGKIVCKYRREIKSEDATYGFKAFSNKVSKLRNQK